MNSGRPVFSLRGDGALLHSEEARILGKCKRGKEHDMLVVEKWGGGGELTCKQSRRMRRDEKRRDVS